MNFEHACNFFRSSPINTSLNNRQAIPRHFIIGHIITNNQTEQKCYKLFFVNYENINTVGDDFVYVYKEGILSINFNGKIEIRDEYNQKTDITFELFFKDNQLHYEETKGPEYQKNKSFCMIL